ncbi:DNA polymerase III subunit gamma and tau [Fodinicola feengrottensis]|uniref:DNA polymerase III subunit gamma and tau n=1 Tax=Fodinicola feengrottensis TaxID=435914 RepID=UPI002442D2ED|nr:DNA polymerase III subunit gamma and tau [Fodinicola feengrottensis]
MANLALYRKYRPRTFAEVVGQEHVTGPLIQALKNGKLNHAYLFSGPRGCGKTSSARILARSMNCEKGPTPTPCGECDSCVALAPNGSGSLDVIEIDAASHNGVEDARDLRERAFFAPVSSRFKVYVIDEAHMVTTAAFNALLKLVEEPPEFVKFVFATTEPEKGAADDPFAYAPLPVPADPASAQLRDLLDEICTNENVKIEPTVLPLVVRAGGGSARDSLSVLDQLLAGAGEDGVTYERAIALLGVTDATLLDDVCDALAAADGAAVFHAVNKVVEGGHDPRRFATDLLERLRDLVVLERVPDAGASGLIDVPADQLERMTGQALRLGPGSLSRMADIVHEGLIQMRGTTSPRLVLELLCARMLLPAAEESHSALMQRLERMERRLEIGGMTSPAPPQPAPVQQAPAQQPAPVRPAPSSTCGSSSASSGSCRPNPNPACAGAGSAGTGAAGRPGAKAGRPGARGFATGSSVAYRSGPRRDGHHGRTADLAAGSGQGEGHPAGALVGLDGLDAQRHRGHHPRYHGEEPGQRGLAGQGRGDPGGRPDPQRAAGRPLVFAVRDWQGTNRPRAAAPTAAPSRPEPPAPAAPAPTPPGRERTAGERLAGRTSGARRQRGARPGTGEDEWRRAAARREDRRH